MSISELLLIAFVALLVFGPEQLPTLARRLGRIMAAITRYQRQAQGWLQQVEQQLTLDENLKKANDADTQYATQSLPTSENTTELPKSMDISP